MRHCCSCERCGPWVSCFVSRLCLDLSLTDDELKEDCNTCALDTSFMREAIYYNQEGSLVRDEHKEDRKSGTCITCYKCALDTSLIREVIYYNRDGSFVIFNFFS